MSATNEVQKGFRLNAMIIMYTELNNKAFEEENIHLNVHLGQNIFSKTIHNRI
jgi:hypothetical protein